jgi:hypothetical protein
MAPVDSGRKWHPLVRTQAGAEPNITVESGLSAGELVVVERLQSPRSGTPVRATPAAAVSNRNGRLKQISIGVSVRQMQRATSCVIGWLWRTPALHLWLIDHATASGLRRSGPILLQKSKNWGWRKTTRGPARGESAIHRRRQAARKVPGGQTVGRVDPHVFFREAPAQP